MERKIVLKTFEPLGLTTHAADLDRRQAEEEQRLGKLEDAINYFMNGSDEKLVAFTFTPEGKLLCAFAK